MIQSPYGAHGSQLRVFGFRDWEFKQLAELEVSAPSDFIAKDVDSDGRLEVVTVDQAPLDLPYVMGFRDEVHYRFDNDTLIEVDRIPLYQAHEVRQGHLDGDADLGVRVPAGELGLPKQGRGNACAENYN